MRNVTEIVIHHSATPRDQNIDAAMGSFDRNHKQRLYEVYQQPISNSDYKYIAYHYCIAGDGTVKGGRSLDVAGYHASNYPVNLESIGICLLGNFDEEHPSQEQYSSLEDLIQKLKKEFPSIKKVSGHRYYADKTCPGKNFTDNMIEYFNSISPQENWWDEAQSFVVKNEISNGERPTDPLLRAEAWQIELNKAKSKNIFGFDF